MAYSHIVVPLDGSQLAEYIVPHVENMARAFDAKITLLHVIDADEPDPQQLTQSQRDARANITGYLEGVAGALTSRRMVVQWTVSFGDPASEITRYAIENEADLVMMSTHGRGDVRTARVGSVALAVVSSGRVPVMMIKPPDEVLHR